MAELAATAAILLALVLGYAGLTKIANHRRTAETFAQLGLPKPTLAAWLVPAAELGIAAALLTTPGWGGVAAAAMLTGFSIYLLALLRSGAEVSCGCFGSSNNNPASSADLGRNLTLITIALGAATIDRLVVPSFASVVVVTIGALTLLLGSQLLDLRGQLGSLFRIQLAGEPVEAGSLDNSSLKGA